MPLKKLRYTFLLLAIGFIAIQDGNAQLLQDRNKLKTEYRRPDGRGFGPFRKKIRNKSASGRAKVETAGTPRASQPMTVGEALFGGKLRFSKKSKGRVVVVNPRFSRKKDIRGDDRIVVPRYSQPRETPRVIVVTPRFSKDPYKDYRARTPKSKSKRGMVFEFPRVQQYVARPKNRGEDLWVPGFSKSYKAKGKLHPSSNYVYAKNRDSKLVRQSLRQFNILWTRVNRNKTSPKIVDKKESKSKYDKDESEIWNNKEREYIKN